MKQRSVLNRCSNTWQSNLHSAITEKMQEYTDLKEELTRIWQLRAVYIILLVLSTMGISFQSHYGPGVDSASNRNEYQENFLGVNAACAYGWQPYHFPVPLSWNLGTLTSWNPLGHSRPVTGLLYLFTMGIIPNKLLKSLKLRYMRPAVCFTMQRAVMLNTGHIVRNYLAEQWMRSA